MDNLNFTVHFYLAQKFPTINFKEYKFKSCFKIKAKMKCFKRIGSSFNDHAA